MKVRQIEFSPVGVLVAAAGYTALIVIHELGHWSGSLLVHFHAPIFRVGFGEPHLVFAHFADTQFRLCPILIGGGVRIDELLVDSALAKDPGPPIHFLQCRLLVLFLGPLYGMLTAVCLALILSRKSARGPLVGSFSLCAQMSWEVFKALWALVRFTNKIESSEHFQYIPFLEIPFRAAESTRTLFKILFSTAVSQTIFNLLPIPLLDGGKMCFDALALFGFPIGIENQAILAILTGLFLVVVFVAALFRGFRWPVPV